MSELMTPKEVAELFKVTVGTVHKWFHSGTLPGVQIARAIRFERSSVEALRKTGKAS